MRIATYLCIAATSVALCAQTTAKKATDSKPAAAKAAPAGGVKDLVFPPLRPVKVPDVTTFTLANGMRVYLLENNELPLVGGTALVRTGNLFDPKDKIGLAEVTGSVMRTGGTKSKTGDELDEQLENVAASVEASIGETSGNVSFSALKENTDDVLALFKEVLTQPEFRQDKIDLYKMQMRSAISRRNDNPGSIASREFTDLIYGKDNPYGWRLEYEHIDRIARGDLVNFHKRYFFPANIMLAVQGDFKAPEMRARIERVFNDWNVKQEAVPAFPKVSSKATPGVYLAEKADVNQTFFQVGHLGGVLRDKDYPALEVMADILGGGFSSRLFAKVRSELGYAYNVGADWGANYNHPGVFRISGSTKSKSTTESIEVIKQEVERLRTSEVTDKELTTAKGIVLNGFVFNFDHPSKTLNRMVVYEYHGYPKDFMQQYQKAIDSVTKADILRVAKEHLKPENFVVVAVGKPDEFGKPLTALDPTVEKIDLTIPTAKPEAAKADAGSMAKGKALLDKAAAAMGGEEKLAAIKTVDQAVVIDINTGQGQMKVNQRVRWLTPGMIRQDQELPFGKMSVYTDGKSGWMSSPQGVQDLPAAGLQQARSETFRFLPLLLRSGKDPNRTVNQIAENTIEISDKEGNNVKMVVDPATGLPAKLVYQSMQMGGGPVQSELTLSGWKEVDGVKLPHAYVVNQGERKFADATVQQWKINTELKAEELAQKP